MIPTGSSGNRIFTAQWDIATYYIYYSLNGGVNHPDNPGAYTLKSPNINLKNPTRTGFVFTGWIEGYGIASGSVGNRTFTVADWSDHGYSIEYNLDGGLNHPDNPAYYTEESPEIILQNPTRAGYTFAGWTEGQSIPAGSTGNKTFTAEWGYAVDYTITYILNGGVNNPNNPSTYTVESPHINLQNPARNNADGFNIFAGWVEGSGIASGSTGNKTFTAQWSDYGYTITYVLTEGLNNPANPAWYSEESPAIILQDPFRDGYFFFAGWQPTGVIPTGSSGDKTFTGQWALVEYPITYDLSGGANDVDNPDIYTIESPSILLKNPSRNGYTFAGWAEGATIPTGSMGDRMFTAQWDVVTYYISYVLDGGVNNVDNPSNYTIESPDIILQDPARTGYIFTGWAEGASIPEGSVGDKTFTALWVEAIDTPIILTFDAYADVKWNNTFLLNLKRLKEEGYDVTGCKWFRNGIQIGEGYEYSAGPERGDQLMAGAAYHFELSTSNRGNNIRSTDKVISLRVSLVAYPNPVRSGAILTIEGAKEGSPIEVYNQNGARVRMFIAESATVTFSLNVTSGIYIVRTGNGEARIVIE